MVLMRCRTEEDRKRGLNGQGERAQVEKRYYWASEALTHRVKHV